MTGTVHITDFQKIKKYMLCVFRAPDAHYCSQAARKEKQSAARDASAHLHRRWPYCLNQSPLQATEE